MLPGVMERYDTGSVPPERRIGYWGDVVTRTTSPAAFDCAGQDELHCSLTLGAFERFTFSHAVTSEISVFRGKEHTHAARGSSYLYLQLEGAGELVSIGKTVQTGPGSLILFDESTPYRFKALSPVRTMAIGFPSSLMATRLPGYRDIAMRALDGDEGLHQVLQAALRSMNSLFVNQGMRRFPRAMFLSLIEMLAASIEDVGACEDNAGTLARWAGKIRAYVEANLDDPDLTPASISAAFGISARYLRLIFAKSGDTPGETETLRRFILRRRLEECAMRLADASNRAQSITELAHSWGFSDSSYFARRFIEYFDATPRAYRATMLREAGLDAVDAAGSC